MKKFSYGIMLFAIVMMMVAQESYGDRCYIAGEYCHVLEGKICCGGLRCVGPAIGSSRKCVPIPGCRPGGAKCNLMNECCYPYQCSAMGEGYCLPRNEVLNELFPNRNKNNDDEVGQTDDHLPLSSIVE
ncbi:hypothetical protein CsatA_005670 [Cannabis sativa]